MVDLWLHLLENRQLVLFVLEMPFPGLISVLIQFSRHVPLRVLTRRYTATTLVRKHITVINDCTHPCYVIQEPCLPRRFMLSQAPLEDLLGYLLKLVGHSRNYHRDSVYPFN